jgi:mannose-6-phosphate isomerase-like protein (cupin superfamily)
MEIAAVPAYSRGDKVVYRDRQERVQQGEIKSVEATWHGFAKAGREPLIVYTVSHPTYRNNRFYTTGDSIIGLSNI